MKTTLSRRNLPNFLGFDSIFNELERASGTVQSTAGYPPYNVISENENAYTVEVAVAGFGKDEVTLEEHNGELIIRGVLQNESESDEQRNYLHKGISNRKFERIFRLAEHVQVAGAVVENGMLTIKLVREVPEELQPRTIKIEYKG